MATSPLTSASGPARLLLVEDSDTSATLIVRYLNGRYEVLHARDGAGAWETLSNDPTIEIVVTDIQMPVMNGHELLMKIRGDPQGRFENLPVIVMTSADDNKERDQAFTYGANDFILKPIDPVELQARLGVHQKLARTIRELEAHRQLLQVQATTDPLTKLSNRRELLDAGARYCSLVQRHGGDLSVAVFDIDHFKNINDTHGHAAGDEALIGIAHILRSHARHADVLARIGGEEFVMLLPSTNRLGAAVLAERIRSAVENHRFTVDGAILSLTLSAGVACFVPHVHLDLDGLIADADKRLYLAKRTGRNRIVARDDFPEEERPA